MLTDFCHIHTQYSFSRPKNPSLFSHFFHASCTLFDLLKHNFLNLFQFYYIILQWMLRSALKIWTTHIHSQWNKKVFCLIRHKFLNNSNTLYSSLFQKIRLIIINVLEFSVVFLEAASHSHSFNIKGPWGFFGGVVWGIFLPCTFW